MKLCSSKKKRKRKKKRHVGHSTHLPAHHWGSCPKPGQGVCALCDITREDFHKRVFQEALSLKGADKKRGRWWIFIIFVEFIEIERISHTWGHLSHWIWSLLFEKSQQEAGHWSSSMCDSHTAALRFNRAASGVGKWKKDLSSFASTPISFFSRQSTMFESAMINLRRI